MVAQGTLHFIRSRQWDEVKQILTTTKTYIRFMELVLYGRKSGQVNQVADKATLAFVGDQRWFLLHQ